MTSEEACKRNCEQERANWVIYSESAGTCLCTEEHIGTMLAVNSQKSKCVNEVYATSALLNKCQNATYLDKQQLTLPLVGLCSVPGAGNTWTRELFQSLTGVYSGSVYRAGSLAKLGFPGETENWENGRTTMIKNHFHTVSGKVEAIA